jgi:FkbM family methyltransferase
MKSRRLQEIAHRAFVGYLRRWPVETGKARLMTALWRPLSFGVHRRTTRLRERRIRMTCDLEGHVQRHLYFLGRYEDANCQRWVELVGGARVVFDVGANAGIYSLLAAVTNPGVTVHAFEPTPAIHATLVENARLTGVERRITANLAGVGQTSGRAFLHECRGNGGDNDGMNFVSMDTTLPGSQSILLHSLDDYCAERGIERIDLMKMAVEGGEAEALLGARRLLKEKAIRALVLELLDWSAERAGHTQAEVLGILRRAGYHLYELRNRRWTWLDPWMKRASDDLFAVAEPL